MKYWFALLLLTALASCKTPLADVTPTVEPTPESTPEEEWTELTREGVTLRIRTPDGWEAMANEYGILLAEHAESLNPSETPGMLVYLFVPEMRDFDVHRFPNANVAWLVLNYIARRRDYVGDATVSDTVSFAWGRRPAAYYLLSDDRGYRTMVIAVQLMHGARIVVFNITTSPQEAHRIHEVLPVVVTNLTVNGEPMDPSAFNNLPNPLPFPERRAETTGPATHASTRGP